MITLFQVSKILKQQFLRVGMLLFGVVMAFWIKLMLHGCAWKLWLHTEELWKLFSSCNRKRKFDKEKEIRFTCTTVCLLYKTMLAQYHYSYYIMLCIKEQVLCHRYHYTMYYRLSCHAVYIRLYHRHTDNRLSHHVS